MSSIIFVFLLLSHNIFILKKILHYDIMIEILQFVHIRVRQHCYNVCKTHLEVRYD